MNDPKVTIAKIEEKIVSLNDKVEAAHRRVDNMQLLIRDDLNEIKESFKEVSSELKDVVAWMNRGKGWAAAAFALASLIGGGLSILINKFIGG